MARNYLREIDALQRKLQREKSKKEKWKKKAKTRAAAYNRLERMKIHGAERPKRNADGFIVLERIEK